MTDLSTITPEQIDERLASLPDPLAAAISSDRISDTVRRIGHAYELDDDHLDLLEQAVAFVFMGFVPLSDLAGYLNNILELEDFTMARNIGSDLNARVFYSTRDQIEALNAEESAGETPAQEGGEEAEAPAAETQAESGEGGLVLQEAPSIDAGLTPPTANEPLPATPEASPLPSFTTTPSAGAAEGAPAAIEAAPVFIHQETESAPVNLKQNFSFPGTSSSAGNMMDESRGAGGELPPRAATIELGGEPNEALKSLFVRKQEIPDATPINYTQFTPEPATPFPSGPVNLTEAAPVAEAPTIEPTVAAPEPLPTPDTTAGMPAFVTGLSSVAPADETPAKKGILGKFVQKIAGSRSEPVIPAGAAKFVNYSATETPAPAPAADNLPAAVPVSSDEPAPLPPPSA